MKDDISVTFHSKSHFTARSTLLDETSYVNFTFVFTDKPDHHSSIKTKLLCWLQLSNTYEWPKMYYLDASDILVSKIIVLVCYAQYRVKTMFTVNNSH
jgi:hypothetical protein